MADVLNNKLALLARQWRLWAIAALLLYSLALSVVLLAAVRLFVPVHWFWLAPMGLLLWVVLAMMDRRWKLAPADVAAHLDNTLPEVQYSSALLLQPAAHLGGLQALQQQKVERLLHTARIGNPIAPTVKKGGFLLLAAITMAYALSQITLSNTGKAVAPISKNINTKPEKPIPLVTSTVVITPPAYTGKAPRRQTRMNLLAEAGSTITWQLTANQAVNSIVWVLNDKVSLPMKKAGGNRFTLMQKVMQSGFYQVKVNGQPSELYQLEVIPDKPPVVNVVSPRSGMVIETGQPQQAMLHTALSDDYGLASAQLVATIASGSGEAVKFSEKRLPLAGFAAGRQQLNLRQLLGLKALGMQPGDELYGFIEVSDNHGQQTRSDVFLVTIQDTAGLMSIEGLVTGLDIKPEFFRSQRQIIIETEQLLKDKDTISLQKFQAKSNDLGIDQKLLRLRYGKFLGEENSEEAGEEHHANDGHDHGGEVSRFGDVDAIMDEFAHKHDIAEDATFFDPETKKQLKATLAEMWNAELKLRTFKPAEALPYEYKALRLLKDLQQKSRVYVAKTGFKATPLKPLEKRLTGELDKIGSPVVVETITPASDEALALRQALGILEQVKRRPANAADSKVLQAAATRLAAAASAQPSRYLQALQAYKRVLGNSYNHGDVLMAQKAIRQLLNAPGALPHNRQQAAGPVSTQYFKNLQKGGL